MLNYVHRQMLPVGTTVLDEHVVPKGRLRHQLDFSGTVGTAAIDIDFGTGYRTIHTQDLTNIARLPYCFECAVQKIRITVSDACELAYFCD